MTEQEAIIQLNFDMEMIRFNSDTGENLTLEQIRLHNEENYKSYLACEVAITALLEIQKYRAIGTPEECRSSVEKQVAKKPREYEDKFYGCPVCGNVLLPKWEKYPTKLMNKKNGLPYCLGCGQKLDWSDDE